ncbi:MAG: RluA family pseudouridine synthase [Pirellulaceae bacterium]|nr:RluA family pseudouridine synthase [Pirellulaceae bacterium]
MAKSNRSRQPELFTVYHIAQAQNGLALAAALKAIVKDCSWGQAKKLLLNRHVQVNGNLCLDAARRVKEKDVVKVWHQPLAKPIESSDLRLAYWDEYLLVVEKPAGVTSVRHYEERKISTKRRQLQPTLEELLPPVLAKVQHLRWPPLPPKGMNRGRLESKQPFNTRHIQNSKLIPPEMQVYPVHRLDRETSGLMLFARTRAAEQKLTAMFRQHTIEREYVAVAIGKVEPQTIRSHLVRDRGDGHRGSAQHKMADAAKATDDADTSEDSQEAVTHIVSAEHIAATGNAAGYSLIRCKLETGRTHQIRIHLSEAGHMLCGDKIYNRTADGTVMNDRSGAPRHALHSDRLAFKHPFTGEKMQFNMPMPRDLASWLNRIQKAASESQSTTNAATPEPSSHDEEE